MMSIIGISDTNMLFSIQSYNYTISKVNIFSFIDESDAYGILLTCRIKIAVIHFIK